jgi:flagellar biosynthetic protein FlhB
VPRSRDLGQAAALLACVMVFTFLGDRMLGALTESIRRALWRMGQSPLAAIDPNEVTTIALQGMWTLTLVVGPLAAGAVVAVVALQAAQGGVTMASEALTFDLSRLSPAQGLRRLLPSQGGIALAKAIAACAVIVFIGWKAVAAGLASSGPMTRVSAVAAAQVGWTEVLALLRKAGIALLLLAGADYLDTRWQFMRSHRMTKQEVRDEHKLLEGNPEIKSRVRRIQRELVRRRMLAAVPRATLVITNPTHYAVALEYVRGALPAPRVVAKGQNFMALRIREIAREHGVPIVENPPLARALYQETEIGDLIPGALFEAVAEVLAYLIRLRQLVL